MDKLLDLLADRRDQVRMRVPERVDRDPGGEVEIALAIRGGKPASFAVIEREIDTRECRQQVRGAHGTSLDGDA